MADTYTKGEKFSSIVDDKQVKITRTWKEDKEESFTVADLERQIDNCDSQITYYTDLKAEYQAKIAEAEKVLAE